MNRVFRSKVGGTFWVVLLVLTACMFQFFWEKEVIPAVMIALLVLFCIEMIIHTRYAVTSDGLLIIDRGRFFSALSIPVSDIVSLKKSKSWESSPALSLDRIQIDYRGKHHKERVYISPQRKEEFVALLVKMNDQIEVGKELASRIE